MVNTVKRLEFLSKQDPNAIAYTEIFSAVHKDHPEQPKWLVFSKMRVTVNRKGISQTATTDTVQDFDTLQDALSCMEKWRVSREQTGKWESLVTIDRTENYV